MGDSPGEVNEVALHLNFYSKLRLDIPYEIGQKTGKIDLAFLKIFCNFQDTLRNRTQLYG